MEALEAKIHAFTQEKDNRLAAVQTDAVQIRKLLKDLGEDPEADAVDQACFKAGQAAGNYGEGSLAITDQFIADLSARVQALLSLKKEREEQVRRGRRRVRVVEAIYFDLSGGYFVCVRHWCASVRLRSYL